MDEYIKRDDVPDLLTDRDVVINPHDEVAFIREDVECLPAADVRPVVLCRDCKFAPSGTDGGEDQGFGLEWPHDEWPEDNPCPCKCADGWYSHKPKPDFFCAAGEKREEN
jgi:hypothetical protein